MRNSLIQTPMLTYPLGLKVFFFGLSLRSHKSLLTAFESPNLIITSFLSVFLSKFVNGFQWWGIIVLLDHSIILQVDNFSWVTEKDELCTERDCLQVEKQVLKTKVSHVLTLKAPITTAADDISCDNFPHFRKK